MRVVEERRPHVGRARAAQPRLRRRRARRRGAQRRSLRLRSGARPNGQVRAREHAPRYGRRRLRGRHRTGHARGRAWHRWARHKRAWHKWAWHGRARHTRARHGRAWHGRAWHGRTLQRLTRGIGHGLLRERGRVPVVDGSARVFLGLADAVLQQSFEAGRRECGGAGNGLADARVRRPHALCHGRRHVPLRPPDVVAQGTLGVPDAALHRPINGRHAPVNVRLHARRERAPLGPLTALAPPPPVAPGVPLLHGRAALRARGP